MRSKHLWVLALVCSCGLASAALPAAPKCAAGGPPLGGWHTVESAENIPMDKLALALKQRLSEAPYNGFWRCPEANAAINLEQACMQVVAGLNVQVVAMLTCSEPKNGARILATAYVPLQNKPVQVPEFWARGWWGPFDS